MLRLNKILIGQHVTLYDYKTKEVLFSCATLIGWSLRAKWCNAPKTLKSADSRIMMVFATPEGEIKLIKDPTGAGAMFLHTSEGIWRVIAK